MKKVLTTAVAVIVLVLIIFGCIKLFTHGVGIDYMDEDRVVMQIEGGDITWREYYGWLCYGRVQVEAMLGSAIEDWTAMANSQQTYAEYVKSYAYYLISTYKAVEWNAAVLGIELTDEERQSIRDELATMNQSERETVYSMYGGEDMYMYLAELDALYTKCHDYQYGENGEKTDDEYAAQYAEQNEFLSFYGLFIEDSAGVSGESIAETVNAAADKTAEISRLREEYEIDDGYESGYLLATGVLDSAAEEALIEVDIGECTWAEADGGVWIMLRAEIDYDGIVYDTENTLREQASWYIFESVVNGWTENMQFMTGDTYNSIDVADVFG